jgi:hypothetical protein
VLAEADGWRRLGWIMADGSLPFGEFDLVDPELAQFEYLPAPNSRPPATTPHAWM